MKRIYQLLVRKGSVGIVLPAVIAIVLFVAALFAFILPVYKNIIWEKKQEMLHELTLSAWSTIEHYHELEHKGLMTRKEAQESAITVLRNMRYGPEMKDYFWINDMDPVMIMHPYRSDLEGETLSTFADPHGKLLFVEFVRVVESSGEGFVDYMWQWKDNPDRIVPKLSYVKGFEPWGWIVGTGLYLEDVRAGIAFMTHRIIAVSLTILGLITFFLVYIVHQNFNVNRDWKNAVDALKVSEERFRELAELLPEIVFEIDKEGTVLFTNKQTTGYTKEDYENGFKGTDIFIPEDRERVKENIQQRFTGEATDMSEYTVLRKDGSTFPAMIRSTPIILNGEIIGLRGIIIDITDQKQAQEALRESEEKYRQLFEMESDGILLIEITTDMIIEANEAATALYGFSRAELLRMKQSDLSVVCTESVPTDEDTIGISPVQLHRRKDGSVFPVEISSQNFTCHGKDVHVAAVRDVTEREKAREEIEQQRSFLKNVIDNAPNFIYVKDKESRIILANRLFAENFNMKPEEMTGKRSADLISDPIIVEMMYHDDMSILKEGKERVEREHLYIDKNEKYCWMYTVKMQMKGRDGKLEQLVGISSDITDLKRAEDALRKSEEEFRVIFETAEDSIFIKNRDLKYIKVNPSMLKLFGAPESEILKCSDIDLYGELAAEEINVIDLRVLEGETIQEEHTLQIRGKQKIFNVIKVPIRDKVGEIIGLCGIARDITESKRLENQFYQSQKMESIGRLAGGIAHDFNNLLTVIIGNADLAMMSIPAGDPLYTDIKEIKINADRAANLTRQLLAFSRRQIIEPRITDLNNIVINMDKMLRRLIGEHLELVTLLNGDIWNVNIDPGQIEQVIINLVINAHDAILPDSGKITVETDNVTLDMEYAKNHTSVVPGDYVLLAISDTGVGMDEATLSHIFEPFFTTKKKGKGTGLGLATCYGIVKQNGGNIWVYSEPEHGTTVKIYLPRTSGIPENPAEFEKLDELSGGNETILLVEDEPALHEMASKILRSKGYNVIGATNGEEAFRLAGNGNFDNIDLLITDVVMPRMGGRELAERILEKSKTVKVLYMSGYTDHSIVNHGILKPGIEFLQKPFTPTTLITKVKNVLGK